MEIYLIRHTKPLINIGQIYGRTDVPLAASFEEEKDMVLKQLPASFDAVYSSPSSRCTLLAAAISAAYLTDPALFELDFGEWEGKTWDTIDRAESEVWMKDFVNLCPPNGETMFEMEQRVLNFWNYLKQQHFKKVAVVTHAGVIRVLTAHQQSIALADAFAIEIHLGAVYHYEISSLSL